MVIKHKMSIFKKQLENLYFLSSYFATSSYLSFHNEEREEIYIIHIFYRYEFKISIGNCSQWLCSLEYIKYNAFCH